jgi:hypothetical protein
MPSRSEFGARPLTCRARDVAEALLDNRQPKRLRLAEMLGNGPLQSQAFTSVLPGKAARLQLRLPPPPMAFPLFTARRS